MSMLKPMKFFNTLLRAVGMLGLLSVLLVGCASQQPQPSVPAGPSAAQIAAGDAIASARAALQLASAKGVQLPATNALVDDAQAAFDKGQYAKATQLANTARRQAEAGLNDYYLQQAQALVDQIKGHALDASQQAELAAIEGLIRGQEGHAAYDRAMALLALVKTAAIDYTVLRGDSLWRISGKGEIYGNPYQWPLIYKANIAKIKDADLIYPGQEFEVHKGMSEADVNAAINHAKTRGAWSIGRVEASDKAYLAK